MRRKIKEFILKDIAKSQWGEEKIWKFGNDYIAGSSLEEGIETIRQYYCQGRYSTLDILGESSEMQEQATRYKQNYIRAIDRLNERFEDKNACTISVKGSSICCVGEKQDEIPSDHNLEKDLEEVVKIAAAKGIHVTLDMEDHRWTDVSLNVAKRLWDKGYNNPQLGIVQQARLDRTEEDINSIILKYNEQFRKGIRVRACKGIYIEPRRISTRSKRMIRRRLIERMKQLFRGGFYVEIATHDHQVIHEIVEYIEENNYKNDRFEFQFLKGVQKGYEIEGKLRKRGYKVRYYMPVELKKYEGVSYMTRRCVENPRLIIDFLKNRYRKYRAEKKL